MFKFKFAARLSAGVVIVAASLSSWNAGAAYASVPAEVKSACKKDFKAFCPHYDLESTALRQCMRSVAGQLSPRCIDALERNGESRRK
jgi:hypothetical protein